MEFIDALRWFVGRENPYLAMSRTELTAYIKDHLPGVKIDELFASKSVEEKHIAAAVRSHPGLRRRLQDGGVISPRNRSKGYFDRMSEEEVLIYAALCYSNKGLWDIQEDDVLLARQLRKREYNGMSLSDWLVENRFLLEGSKVHPPTRTHGRAWSAINGTKRRGSNGYNEEEYRVRLSLEDYTKH